MVENKNLQDSLLKIEPGLSYILTNQDHPVVNKGFGEFRPGEEFWPYVSAKEFRKNVKHVVLSGDDARASINYELDDEDLPKQLSFSLGEGEKKVFGSGGEKKYLSMIIKINPPGRYHVLQEVVEAVDENAQPHNKQGKQCELGRDGRFHDSRVIIGKFYKQKNFSKESFERIVGKEVFDRKGFKWYCTEDEDDFLKNLEAYDVAWVIGYNTAPMKNKDFPQRMIDFHRKGKGLMLWEDDDPKTQGTHTVEVLKHMFPMEPKIELTGNYEGKKLMAPSDNWLNLSGKFSKNHPIFRGVCNMYEGFTICYPKSSELPKGIHSIATANNGKSNIMCKEKDFTSGSGRLIIDCACTKLFEDWWQSSIGTATYVRNATCWLAAQKHEFTDTSISLGAFLIPEKTLKDKNGKEMRFVEDFKLNQGNLGTCTGYAAVSSLMYQAGSSELNPKSIYVGTEATEGLFIKDAMERIKKNGVTLHTFNENNIQNIFWKFEEYLSLPITQGDPKNVSKIEEALDEHKLPIVGTVNAKSFSDYKEEFKGLLDKPKENLAANHAVLIIGYDKNQQKIIIKNSWNDGNNLYPYNEFIKGLNCAYIGKGAKSYIQ